MSDPLVSICIPTRNRASSLRESLKNICAQDYSQIEIVISDNCSDDHTGQVGRELAESDSRVTYVRHNKNLGLHGNHNFCLEAGRGNYLCIFHDHDTHSLSIVSEYVSFLEAHPTVGVVCSDWELIDDSDKRIGVRDSNVESITPGLEYISRTIRSGRSSLGIPGAMIRRVALGDARFVLDAPIGFGDFPLWFRIAEQWDVGHICKRLWSWRQNRESHSARTIQSISYDYQKNLDAYCDEHLARRPDHQHLVKEWRASLRRYLFWALTYEVGLHFRHQRRRVSGASPSLFEIMDYRLTQEQFRNTLEQMQSFRTGALERATYAAVTTAVRLGFTGPLAWVTGHRTMLRALLGLK